MPAARAPSTKTKLRSVLAPLPSLWGQGAGGWGVCNWQHIQGRHRLAPTVDTSMGARGRGGGVGQGLAGKAATRLIIKCLPPSTPRKTSWLVSGHDDGGNPQSDVSLSQAARSPRSDSMKTKLRSVLAPLPSLWGLSHRQTDESKLYLFVAIDRRGRAAEKRQERRRLGDGGFVTGNIYRDEPPARPYSRYIKENTVGAAAAGAGGSRRWGEVVTGNISPAGTSHRLAPTVDTSVGARGRGMGGL